MLTCIKILEHVLVQELYFPSFSLVCDINVGSSKDLCNQTSSYTRDFPTRNYVSNGKQGWHIDKEPHTFFFRCSHRLFIKPLDNWNKNGKSLARSRINKNKYI